MTKDPLRGGRLGDSRPSEVWDYLSSMEADRFIGMADVSVDIAHLLMLSRQEIIDQDSAKKIMTVLLKLHDDGLPDSVYDEKFEDVHAGIEAYIIDKIGIDSGGRLHMGRSRNDEVATCVRIRLREEILDLMSDIAILRSIFCGFAKDNTDIYMPGFTHLQHAQPTTVAHYLMNYEQAFKRDFERLGDAYLRIDQCPLGAAAFASTGYPIDREYTSDLLGFGGVLENTMDCVAGRDFALEVISDCAILMNNISRLCEEVIFWSSSFVNFVILADEYCSTSSIMPQKKNPDCAEIMRGKAGSVSGCQMAAFSIIKNLPMSYNRDMQELWPHLWKAISDTKSSIKILNGMIRTAHINRKRMAEEAVKGNTTATELADILVREYGLAFRTAHNIVGRAVRIGKLDLETLEMSAKEMAGISLVELGLTEDAVADGLEVSTSVNVRNATGGPSPQAVMASIMRSEAAYADDLEWIRGLKMHLHSSEKHMIEKARELVME
jgi:argininosuccinate lyase